MIRRANSLPFNEEGSSRLRGIKKPSCGHQQWRYAMDFPKDVLVRATDAAMNGDMEALWVIKLLLTHRVPETPSSATSDSALLSWVL